jgi:hypothetical protein
VQPDFDDLRPVGVTNHYSRIAIPNDPVNDNASFLKLVENINKTTLEAVDTLTSCEIDYLVMGMSAATFWNGRDGAEKYLKMMETSTVYKGQIDYDLIKDDYVYYFVMTPTELVLTHINPIYADHFSGIEENIRLIDEDQAFLHHLPYNMFSDEVTLEDLNILLDEYVSFENGINLYQVYYFPSYIQIWSKSYSVYKSFEKPDGLSIYKYYFMTLNKYYKDINNVIEDDDMLLGSGLAENVYFDNLFCDINSFVKYYPEYEIECSKITNGLMEYVGNDIKKLDYLMSLDYNEALGLITPIPSRRGSFI